jgi:DNA-binding HxlR family transcriptional regulator
MTLLLDSSIVGTAWSWESILRLLTSQERENPDIETAIRLFHRRWSVPTVATLHRDGPCSFSELVGRLGASRDTLSETLRDLIANGVVARAEGTRAAYGLTADGERLADASLEAVRVVGAAGLVQVALKKWPMLVLVAVARGNARYGELRAALPGITPRALALALKDLEGAGLVARSVTAGYPPATGYQVAARREDVVPAMEALVAAAEALRSGERPSAAAG